METTRKLPPASYPAGRAILASLLPLWLVSVSITTEGFPHPPIPVGIAVASFVSAILVSYALWSKERMPGELILYSFTPLALPYVFDEISTTYKTPFILLCALLLTAGSVAYQRRRSTRLGWLILPLAALLTLAAAVHGTDNYWDMVSTLGFEQCFPDASDCGKLTIQNPFYWLLFFEG